MSLFSPARIGLLVLLVSITAACSPAPTPDELLARAGKALESGDINAAVIDAKSALQQDPENAEGRAMLGEAYYRQRQLEAAAVELERSLAVRPDPAVAALYAEALVAAGESQRLVAMRQEGGFEFALGNVEFMATLARAQALGGDTFTAEQTLAAVELNPSRTRDRLLLVKLLLDRGAAELAADMLRPATSMAPNHPGVLYAQARLLLAQGQPRAALELFQQVLAVDSSHLPSLYLAGIANVLEGNFATARLQLSQFLNAQPDHVNARLLQANVHLQLGEMDVARVIAQGVLDDDPENMPARQILADSEREGLTALAIGDGDFEAALANVQDGLRLQPDNLQGLLDLAAVHARAGDLDEMAESLQHAVNTHPTAAEPRLVLARYLLQQGQPEAAVSLLRELPDHPRVLFLLAQIEQSRNDPLASEGFLRRALELDPQSDDARKLLVASLLLQGKVEQAEELQKLWLGMLPDDIQILHEIAAIYLARAWDASARIVYEHLRALAPDDVVALNNLAWIQRDENPGQALDLVKRALQTAPGHAGVLDTKAMVLFHQGQLDRALEVNQQSLDATPGKPVYRLHRARIFVAAGDRNTAMDTLQQLLAEYSEFEERAEADVLLRELGGDAPGQ